MARASREILDDVDVPTSRADALAAGVCRYFTGVPCKHGHISVRLSKTAHCVRCRADEKSSHRHKDRSRAWRDSNPDRVRELRRRSYWKDVEASREANKENYRKHADQRKAQVKKYIAKNRDSHSRWAKKWSAANPEKRKSYCLNRRARLVASGGEISARDIKVIIGRQRGRCASCGQKSNLAMDHIMPLALGGSGAVRNFQGLCRPCNSAKHAKHPIDFNRSRGLLL